MKDTARIYIENIDDNIREIIMKDIVRVKTRYVDSVCLIMRIIYMKYNCGNCLHNKLCCLKHDLRRSLL